MPRPRLLIPLLATLHLVAATSACGASPSAWHRVRQAPALTRAGGSARLSLTVALGLGATTRRSTMAGDGVVDFARRRVQLRLDMVDLGLGLVDERLVESTVYLRVPRSTARPWLASTTAGLEQLTGVDPAAALDYLTGVTRVVARGPGRIDGERVAHFGATVRLSPTAARDLGRQVLAVDVWLDPKGRVARLSYAVDLASLPSAGRAHDGLVRTTLTFTGYGVATAIEPPPPDQIAGG